MRSNYKVEEIDKISNIALTLIAIFCSVCLFAPPSILMKVRLNGLVDEYGGWAGAFWLLSIIYLLIRIMLYLFKQLKRLWGFINMIRRIKAKMKRLSPHERGMLDQIYKSEDFTTPWPVHDYLISGLNEIVFAIQPTPSGGSPGVDYWDYTFSKYGLKYYQKFLKTLP